MPLSKKIRALFSKSARVSLGQDRHYHYWQNYRNPPHRVKRDMVAGLADRYKTPILVETGTFMGDMVYAMKDKFETIYSIELSAELHQKALQRFSGLPHIQLLQGDSGKQIDTILPKINKPTLFWLDGHYSGGFTAKADINTPIIEELRKVLTQPYLNHVILIDDARCFNGTDDYPSVKEIFLLVQSLQPNLKFNIENDCIQLTP